MTDETRPENPARPPEESPEELGNTIDGSHVGDGSATRGEDAVTAGPGPGPLNGGGTATGGGTDDGGAGAGASGPVGEGAARREEQKKVYQTPEQPGHAVGGSDGTADGQ